MSTDSFHSVDEAAVEDAGEAQAEAEQPDANLDGEEPNAEQAEPDAGLKRPAEDAEEPVAKRPKGSGTVPERIESVCGALSDTEINTPWSASFRELLLALLPASLGTPQGQRKSSDDVMLRMLDEIFNVEEERRETHVAKTQRGVESSKKKKCSAVEAVNSVEEELEEEKKTIKEKWEVLPEDVLLVFLAEGKWRQSVEVLLGKQKEAIETVKRDCFGPLKAGSFASDAEQQQHVEDLTFLMEHIADSVLVESCTDVLSKKMEARGSFGAVVIQQVEDCLDKYMSLLGLFSRNVAAAVQETAPPAEKMSFEQAEALMKDVQRGQWGEYRGLAIEAKKSFKILKDGFDGKPGKHINLLKKVCRKFPDGKALYTTFPKVMEKKPDARSESEGKVVEKLQEVLDQRIASLEAQLGEDGLATWASQQQLESCVNVVLEIVEDEAQQRAHKQKQLAKEKNSFLELKTNTLDPLRDGSWTSPEVPKPLMAGLRKLFKQVEMDAPTAKTLTAVLKKKPDDRGTFDATLVTQFEETVRKRLATFDDTVVPADTVGRFGAVKEAAEAVEQTQEALENAKEQQQKRLEVALGAENERRRLELAVEQKMTIMNERGEEEKQAAVDHADKQAILENFQKARDNLAFLRERAESGDAQ